MRFLLDVNVLIALIDSEHVMHDSAHKWFANTGEKAWATCPLTQNGVLRIVGHARYSRSLGTPAAIADFMKEFLLHPGHEFWPDDISMLQNHLVRTERLLDSSQVTDTYLLAMAAAHGGKLATFDRRLVIDAVIGGASALHLIE